MKDVKDRTRKASEGQSADVALLVILDLLSLALWMAYDAAGVDLRVRVDEGIATIDATGIVVTTAVATALALSLRWALRNRPHGLRTWSILAGITWAVSFLGPLGAMTTESMLALASLHVLVGGGIFFGVRRIHGGAR